MEGARVSNAVVLVCKLAPAPPPPMPSHKGCTKLQIKSFSILTNVLTLLIDTWSAAAQCAAGTRGRSACPPGSGQTPSSSTCSASLAGAAAFTVDCLHRLID